MTDDETLAIEQHCTRLQVRYAVHADHREAEKFTQVFAEDGSIEVPDSPAFVGHEAIRGSIESLGSLPITYRHVITNSVIDVVDADRANGLCYLLVFNAPGAEDPANGLPSSVPATIGEYHDTFRRTPAGWRIQTRKLVRVFRSEQDAMRKAVADLMAAKG